MGADAAGAGRVGDEMVGEAAGAFATGGAWCFPAMNESAATRTIAAAETRISLVDFDLVGCSGWDEDEGDVTVATGATRSAPGTMAGGCGASRGSGGVVSTLTGGTMLAGAVLGKTLLAGTMLGGTLLDGTMLGGILLGEAVLGGTMPVVGLDGTWITGIWAAGSWPA